MVASGSDDKCVFLLTSTSTWSSRPSPKIEMAELETVGKGDTTWRRRRRRRRGPEAGPGAAAAVAAAVLLLLAAFVGCALLSGRLSGSVRAMMRQWTALAPGSSALAIWTEPPLKPRLKVFVFNVTNAALVSSGVASRPRLQEVGPFVYEAEQERVVDSWGGPSQREEVTFRSRTTYHFVPSESVASDAETVLTVPNLLPLTGMLGAEVREQPDFVKQSVVWPLLQGDDNDEDGSGTDVFTQMSVAELLWGKHDERACMGEEQEEEEELFGGDEDWVTFGQEEAVGRAERDDPSLGRRRRRPRPSYRRPDGRCAFGLLVHKNATLGRPATIATGAGRSEVVDKGRLLLLDSHPDLGVWKNGSGCDSLSGATEITALPPMPVGQKEEEEEVELDVFVGIMCRKIRLKSVGSKTVDGVSAVRLVAARDTFNFTSSPSSSSSCFVPSVLDSPLPPGAMDLAPCYEGAPIMASFPYFLHADQWYLSHLDGLPPPPPPLPSTSLRSPHEFFISLDPVLGVPVAAQVRFQLNLALRRDTSFPPLRRLRTPSDGGRPLVLPLLWAQEGFDSLGGRRVAMLRLALAVPALAEGAAMTMLFLPGLSVILFYFRRFHRDRLYRRRYRGSKAKGGRKGEEEEEDGEEGEACCQYENVKEDQEEAEEEEIANCLSREKA